MELGNKFVTKQYLLQRIFVVVQRGKATAVLGSLGPGDFVRFYLKTTTKNLYILLATPPNTSDLQDYSIKYTIESGIKHIMHSALIINIMCL